MRGFSFQCCCPTPTRDFDLYGPYTSPVSADPDFGYFYVTPVIWQSPEFPPHQQNSQTIVGWSIPHTDEVEEKLYLTLGPIEEDADKCFGIRGDYDGSSSDAAVFCVDVRDKSEVFDHPMPAVQSPSVTLTPREIASSTFWTCRAANASGQSMFSASAPSDWRVVAVNASTFAVVLPRVELSGGVYHGAIIEVTAAGATVTNTTVNESQLQTSVVIDDDSDYDTDPNRIGRGKVVCPRDYPSAFAVKPPNSYSISLPPVVDQWGTIRNHFEVVMGDLSNSMAGVVTGGTLVVEDEIEITLETGVAPGSGLQTSNLAGAGMQVTVYCADSLPSGEWACVVSWTKGGRTFLNPMIDNFESHYLIRYSGGGGSQDLEHEVSDEVGVSPIPSRGPVREMMLIDAGADTYLAMLDNGRVRLLDLGTGQLKWSDDEAGFAFFTGFGTTNVEPHIIGGNEKYLYVDLSFRTGPGGSTRRDEQYRYDIETGEREKFFPAESISGREWWWPGHHSPHSTGSEPHDGRQVDCIHHYEAVNALIQGE